MTDYILVTAEDRKGLNAAVVEYLADGYSLHGSPGIAQGVNGLIFYQAVAK